MAHLKHKKKRPSHDHPHIDTSINLSDTATPPSPSLISVHEDDDVPHTFLYDQPLHLSSPSYFNPYPYNPSYFNPYNPTYFPTSSPAPPSYSASFNPTHFPTSSPAPTPAPPPPQPRLPVCLPVLQRSSAAMPHKQKSAPSPRDQPELSSDSNNLPTSAMEPQNMKAGFGMRRIYPVQPDDGAAATKRQERARPIRLLSTGAPTETQLPAPKKQKSAPSPRDQPKLSSDSNNLPTSAMEPRNTKAGFGRRRIYPVQLDPVILKIWHSELLPNIERSLSALPSQYKPRSLSVNLLGIGESQESAKPTIIITCDGPNSQIIKKYLLQKFPVHKTLGFDLKVRKGATTRCSRILRKRWALRSRGAEALRRQEDPSVKINRSIQSKPSPGASICAYRDGWELPPGTFGGVIEIDGDCFGMTVHHLLDLLSLGLESESVSNESTSAMDELWEEEPEALSLPEETADDEDDPMLWESDVDDSDEDIELPWDIEIPWETSFDGENTDSRITTSGGALTPASPDDPSPTVPEPGDVPGLNPDHTENILIMQPAFHDFENLPDQDPSSQVFGHLHASSGLRRLHHSGTSHEIDWALFEVNEDRLSPANLIRGAGKFCPGVTACNDRRDVVLQRILRVDELASKSVHASGRTTGLQRGVISPAMGLVMLPGRETSSMSWHVVGNLGVEGDSGSWVVDEAAGVAGVVLARVEGLNQTYIAPMEMLVADIKRTLGVDEIGLPGQTGVGVQKARMVQETVAPIEVFMGAGKMEGLTAVEMEVRSPVL